MLRFISDVPRVPSMQPGESMQEGSPSKGEPSSSSVVKTTEETYSSEPVAARNATELLNALDISVTDRALQALAALLSFDLPVNEENLSMLLASKLPPFLGAFVLHLGALDATDQSDILSLVAQGLSAGENLNESLTLLERVLGDGSLGTGELRTLLSGLGEAIGALFNEGEQGFSIERWTDILRLSVSRDFASQASWGQETISNGFFDEARLVAWLEGFEKVLNYLGQMEGEQTEWMKSLQREVRKTSEKLTRSLGGMVLTKSYLRLAPKTPVEAAFFVILWNQEVGTMAVAFENDEQGKQNDVNDKYASSFILFLPSWGHLKGRLELLNEKCQCLLFCEKEAVQRVLYAQRKALLERFDNAGLKLQRFECYTVAPSEANTFFLPPTLNVVSWKEDPELPSRVDLMA